MKSEVSKGSEVDKEDGEVKPSDDTTLQNPFTPRIDKGMTVVVLLDCMKFSDNASSDDG